MKKRAAPHQESKVTKTQTQLEAEKLLNELLDEEPRLRDRGQTRFSPSPDDTLSDEAIQIYRQRLRK